MSQQNQGQGQADDQEILKLFIFGIITVLVLGALLATQENRLNAFIGAVSWLHIMPFAQLAIWAPVLIDIPLIGPWIFASTLGALSFLEDGSYAYMTAEARSFVLTASGRAATLIYGGFLMWIAFRGQNFRVDQKFRTRHTLESMIWLQSEMWLTSRISRHVNPLDGDEVSAMRLSEAAAKKIGQLKPQSSSAVSTGHVAIQPSSWNRALRPEEWLLSSGLTLSMKRFEALKSGEGIVRDVDFEFRKEWERLHLETLSEVLSEQLRAPWEGVEKLRPCHAAAYAVMALFYAYDIKAGNQLLSDLGALADLSKGKRGSLDKILTEEDGMMTRIKGICEGKTGRTLALLGGNSAWVESAFPVFLAAARKDRGVLPSAAFLWMKSEDRLMWYILNNVGNDAICVEAAGALAHSRAEQQIQRKIRRPAVYQASRAMLEDYLDMTKERVMTRYEKEVRVRSPGAQLGLIRDDILKGEVS